MISCIYCDKPAIMFGESGETYYCACGRSRSIVYYTVEENKIISYSIHSVKDQRFIFDFDLNINQTDFLVNKDSHWLVFTSFKYLLPVTPQNAQDWADRILQMKAFT